MEQQDWKGNHLDKDIIVPGNKVYSADTCCFVAPSVNSLLTDGSARRGRWPIGVSWNKRDKKFTSNVSYKGKVESLGYFTTPEAAHKAYVDRKKEIIYEVAIQQTDKRVMHALLALSDRRAEQGDLL